ncbi:hypothetical protein AK830_g6697 [Neonectria ditissima]|uniref:NACHT domain-containing protein n=1 Tax=Neonectria ditissima TaxID=78410 RepID=A0A0N8H6T6_9HYPO|nr:hypothetical protein AK830_g6697 [Neonectria ditissima]
MSTFNRTVTGSAYRAYTGYQMDSSTSDLKTLLKHKPLLDQLAAIQTMDNTAEMDAQLAWLSHLDGARSGCRKQQKELHKLARMELLQIDRRQLEEDRRDGAKSLAKIEMKAKSLKEQSVMGELRSTEDNWKKTVATLEGLDGNKRTIDSETYPVDIIAVHGLNGDAYSTWTHSLTGTLWLRDFLPNFLPGCRVYTYGYPSKLFCDVSRGRVQEFGRGLLASGTRPIIFVCHSLGGIVCKQALVFAHEDDNTYGAMLKSTIGVTFLATPHAGSDGANLASVVLTIVNTFNTATTAGLRPRVARTELLDYLGRNSDALQDLLVSARHRLHNLSVVSFYETQATPPLSFLRQRLAHTNLADRLWIAHPLAQLGLSNEDPIPLYENHRSICRFSSETSSSYMAVAKALRRIVRQSPDVTLALRRASTPSSYRSESHGNENPYTSPDRLQALSDVETACMTLLNDSDAARHAELPPKPIPGTCQWIRSHQFFVSWLEKDSNALLWLTGNPGCGKTTLSYSLAQNFEEAQRSRTVIIYLCQNKNKQADARAVLMGLIFQMIERHRSMIRHVRRVFELQGSSMIQSFSSLWGIFLRIVKDPKAGSLFVILDALDECEKVSCHQLLESISNMLADSSHTMQGGTKIKFLITSRPFLHQSYANTKQALQPQISIDDGQAGYVDDLQKFIRERVDDISLNRQYPSDVREFLFQSMISKADRTFLWAHVVLASVEKSLLTSRKDFQNIIASIPEDLANTYRRYLSDIPSDHQDDASHLLKLLMASARPLHLNELNTAFTMDSSHVTAEDVARDTQNAIAHTIQGILGPLVRVSGPHVSLIHQSVKEFLLEPVAGKYESFPAMRTVNAQSSALRLATVCIQYLLLDDFKNDLFSTSASPAEPGFQMPELLDELPLGDFTGGFGDEEDNNLNSDALFREEDELDPEICLSLTSNYGFYSYASLHWAEHFAVCEDSASEQLRNAARSLLDVTTGSCRNWSRFYRTQAVTTIDNSLIDHNPIVVAAQFNIHTVLKDLLDSCEDAQAIKDRSLYWASQLGHERIVACLLVAGAEPDSVEPERQTALTTASEHGNLACVVTLLADERTNIIIAGRRGRTALSFACGSGHDSIVKELPSRSSCNADDPDDLGATPFVWAVGGEHRSIIASLARHSGVDINHRDKTGRTVVSWAAGDGMDVTLKQLLKLPGIDVNIKDNKGKSPLSWAAGNGCADTTEVLLQSSLVDIKSIDNDKRSAISWASGGGNHDTPIKLLDKGCPGVDTEDIDGWTPLAWAIQTDSPETVQALINDKSVQIERRDHGGRTALSWAVEYGHASIVKVLLQAGADPEAENKRGSTPISIAEQFERNDLLSELRTYDSSLRVKE